MDVWFWLEHEEWNEDDSDYDEIPDCEDADEVVREEGGDHEYGDLHERGWDEQLSWAQSGNGTPGAHSDNHQ